MTNDTEKVIKGLEIHLKPNSRCVGCPYPNNGLCGDQLYRDALALLKAQEPRVMTLEEAVETVSKEGGFVWIEQKNHPLDASHLYPSNNICDSPFKRFVDYGKEFIPKKNSVRSMWRCWSSWPTDEQREAVKWDVDIAYKTEMV